jgi:hypothetical protein
MANRSMNATLPVVGLILALSSPVLAKTPLLPKARTFLSRMIPERFQPKPHPPQVQSLIANAKIVRPSFLESVGSSASSAKFDNYLCDQVSKTPGMSVYSVQKLGKLAILGTGKERLATEYATQHEQTLSAKDFVMVTSISPYGRTAAVILGDAAKRQFPRWSVEDLNTLRKAAPYAMTKLMIWDLMLRKAGKPENQTMSLKERLQAAF